MFGTDPPHAQAHNRHRKISASTEGDIFLFKLLTCIGVTAAIGLAVFALTTQPSRKSEVMGDVPALLEKLTLDRKAAVERASAEKEAAVAKVEHEYEERLRHVRDAAAAKAEELQSRLDSETSKLEDLKSDHAIQSRILLDEASGVHHVERTLQTQLSHMRNTLKKQRDLYEGIQKQIQLQKASEIDVSTIQDSMRAEEDAMANIQEETNRLLEKSTQIRRKAASMPPMPPMEQEQEQERPPSSDLQDTVPMSSLEEELRGVAEARLGIERKLRELEKQGDDAARATGIEKPRRSRWQLADEANALSSLSQSEQTWQRLQDAATLDDVDDAEESEDNDMPQAPRSTSEASGAPASDANALMQQYQDQRDDLSLNADVVDQASRVVQRLAEQLEGNHTPRKVRSNRWTEADLPSVPESKPKRRRRHMRHKDNEA